VVPGAGFTFETGCLLRGLADDFELTFLRTEYGGVPGQAGLPHGESFTVQPFETHTQPSVLQSARAFVDAFFVTLKVLHRRKVELVVVVGSPHAVPILLAARLSRVRTAFVESITRVDQLSQTGNIVRRLGLASHLFVQWPALRALYVGVELGTIL
jgi:hypothetical protein